MTITYRRALESDLSAIVTLLAEDVLGAAREADDEQCYREAFGEIQADPNQFLCVVDDDGEIIGTLQLSFIPGLARGGAKRGQIEAVRIAGHRRSEGLGEKMFAWAIEQCRTNRCALVQLTTDKARADAHRFYDRLGFRPSHIGYKLAL